MIQNKSVPRLNLAPNLKNSLSFWNPLDYLRLFYWAFFFPQALQWYAGTFKNQTKQNFIEIKLIIQGWFLVIFSSLFLGIILQNLGCPFNWYGVKLSLFFGFFIFGFFISEKKYLNNSTESGIDLLASIISFNLMFSLISSLLLGFIGDIHQITTILLIKPEVAVALGIGFGLIFGTIASFSYKERDNSYESIFDYIYNIATVWFKRGFFIVGLIILILVFNQKIYLLPLINFFIAFYVAQDLYLHRLDDWISNSLISQIIPIQKFSIIAHVTPLPLPNLSSLLTKWLVEDWETGLYNINQVLAYSLQLYSVNKALNNALVKTPPEQLILRLSQLTDEQLENLRYILEPGTHLYPNPSFDTEYHAAWYGFWSIHKIDYYWGEEYRDRGAIEAAIRAFYEVRSLPYGQEMHSLTQTLAAYLEADELVTIAMLQKPVIPPMPLLRHNTWATLDELSDVIQDIRIIKRSTSPVTRTFALNRVLGILQKISKNISNRPQEADLKIISLIITVWENSLLRLANKLGEISITEFVHNPYIVGDPVEGKRFVGREDVIRELEELWVMGYQLQSVVLYGHRRMGKTSILVNAANSLGAGIQLVYVNLLRLGDTPQGVGEVLMAITDEIFQAVKIPPPTDADLLNLPYRTFERYFKQVEAQLKGGLIIALDEFEKIEELIEAGRIPQDFMGFLRGLVQMSSKVAFAFAGLHTLEEMTADYFQPLFASFIPIHIGFLKLAATKQILANPDEDFPLDYTPEALDEIYALTHGQPYLVQFVGFQLVRRYNDFVFEQGHSRNPVFTVEDVAAVINDPELFKRGRYYFDGVWGQAMRGADGQQAIIQVLAPHPEGLSLDALAESTAMGREELQAALAVLMRHDVVAETGGRWRIIVELFRRWVVQNHPLSGG